MKVQAAMKGEKKVWEVRYADGTVLYFKNYKDHLDDVQMQLKASRTVQKPVSVRRIKQTEMPEGATIHKPNTKMKAKLEHPFLLGAAVAIFPRTGLGKTGQIVKITKSLLMVKWDGGTTEFFGRAGQPFYGKVDGLGEAIRLTASGKPIEGLWGTDEDPHLTIATASVKQTLAEKRKKSEELRAQRQAERAQIEADPIYQKRQADLKKYSELIQGIGHVENSWNKQTNFRIELENISPDRMDALVDAIRKTLFAK